jgi:YbgC/YbaW family acyl-CoA thioester hydrolase
MSNTAFKTQFTIEWGDCDEAGIVFYPNYFYWLDCSFQRLLRARGLSLREVRKRFGAVTPITQAHADFTAPARYDDVLDIAVSVALQGERRFRVDYDFTSNGKRIGSGHEVRAFALIGADGTIKGAPVDAEFMSTLVPAN